LNTNERTLTVIVRHACSHLAYVSVETPTEAVAKIVELADKGLVPKAIARIIEGEWPSVTRAQACVSRGSCFRLTRTDPFHWSSATRHLWQRDPDPLASARKFLAEPSFETSEIAVDAPEGATALAWACTAAVDRLANRYVIVEAAVDATCEPLRRMAELTLRQFRSSPGTWSCM
jgi:hypothetical protein